MASLWDRVRASMPVTTRLPEDRYVHARDGFKNPSRIKRLAGMAKTRDGRDRKYESSAFPASQSLRVWRAEMDAKDPETAAIFAEVRKKYDANE